MIDVSTRPGWRITAPARRARERIVFDVPTACIGCFDLGNDLTIGSRILRMFLRAASRSSSSATPLSGRNSRVTRPAPAGTDSATVGSSSEPMATSSEPPPMSMTSKRPASQPYQRRAARKVSRASSTPDSTVTGWPMASSILRRILPPFGASRSAEVARTSSWVISYSSASFIAFSTALSKASVPAFLMLPSSLRYCIRRMVLLVLASGSGRAPGAASTMSMWTVFEPISSTPSRVACECNVTMVHSIIV